MSSKDLVSQRAQMVRRIEMRQMLRDGEAKRLRTLSGTTTRELAEILGADVAHVSRWENSPYSYPSREQTDRWCDVIDSFRAAAGSYESPRVRIARVVDWCETGKARQIRMNAGLSVPELAAESGLRPASIYGWETGKRHPRSSNALVYLHILESIHKEGSQS